MKYKLKDSYKGIYNRQFEKGQVIDSNDEYTGIVIEVPFTDQRFFEPIKTRKFQVEVSEDNVNSFEFLMQTGHDDRWTVTEITETEWIKQFKAQYPYSATEFRDEQLESFEPKDLIAEYGSAKLEAVKWIKYHYNVGLKAAKELTDFTYANINFI